jgi:3-methyladenine DNA glycosylase AlkC
LTVAEPFKNLINADEIRKAAKVLAASVPRFDAAQFVSKATAGLDTLELKARAMQVCAALESTLPADFERCARYLCNAMRGDDGLRGWILWPAGEYIARRGQQQPEIALALLHTLTPRFTAEWAIRPFIERHTALTFETLHRWTTDPDEHVRRLVSEGSRPRLPWGLQLKGLIADPSPTLPLLRALQDDTSEYVRRSVANHLNDIAKDHPALVAAWVEEHLADASPERKKLLRHASRTLIKAGDRRTLAAFGLGGKFKGHAAMKITPRRIELGQTVELCITLSSSARTSQSLEVDYAVHHVKSRGHTTAKVFKGWRVELGAGQERVLGKRHSMKPITTRVYHPGRHAVDLLVNGQVVAQAAFDLTTDPPRRRTAVAARPVK